MKPISITVERNYRIDNTDQYMKARLSQTVEPEEGETTEQCTIAAIQQMDSIFRLAYPHVDEFLNFPNSIRQLRLPANHPDTFDKETHYVKDEYNPSKSGYSVADVETVKKEIQKYKLGAAPFKAVYGEMVKGNEELQKVFDDKLEELSKAKS